VIESPNEFIKNSKVNRDQDNLNKSQSECLEFWNRFNKILINRGKPLRKPYYLIGNSFFNHGKHTIKALKYVLF